MTVFDEEKILVKVQAKNIDAIPLAIAFPNSYSIGMASLGYQTAWKLFNQNENVKAIRWFTDIQEDFPRRRDLQISPTRKIFLYVCKPSDCFYIFVLIKEFPGSLIT